MVLQTANSYNSSEIKHPAEHCSLSCRACGSVGAPCSCLSLQLLQSSTTAAFHTLPSTTVCQETDRQVFNLSLHGSCYSHVCKCTFLFQTDLPTSPSSSRPVLDAPMFRYLQWPIGLNCPMPTRAALWQLQCYVRTQ